MGESTWSSALSGLPAIRGRLTLGQISLNLDGVLVHGDRLPRHESALVALGVRLVRLLRGHRLWDGSRGGARWRW